MPSRLNLVEAMERCAAVAAASGSHDEPTHYDEPGGIDDAAVDSDAGADADSLLVSLRELNQRFERFDVLGAQLTEALTNLLHSQDDPRAVPHSQLDDTLRNALYDAGVNGMPPAVSSHREAKALVPLLEIWHSWASTPCDVLAPFPGSGRQLEGEIEVKPFSGLALPKVVTDEAPEQGWEDSVLAHVRHSFSRRLHCTGMLDHWMASGSMSHEELIAKVIGASRRLKSAVESSAFSLSLQPRGVAEGMFLRTPLIDDTPAEHRGVATVWWLAVANSCPFVYSRVAAACFVEPLTRAHSCPIFFLVPPQYRRRPAVFLCHAWSAAVTCSTPLPPSLRCSYSRAE